MKSNLVPSSGQVVRDSLVTSYDGPLTDTFIQYLLSMFGLSSISLPLSLSQGPPLHHSLSAEFNESSHRTNQSTTFSPHLTADGQAESTYAKSFTDTGEWRVSRVFLFPVMPLTELTIPDLILDIFLSSSQNDNIPYSFSASLLLKSGFLISFLSRLPGVRHQDGHCWSSQASPLFSQPILNKVLTKPQRQLFGDGIFSCSIKVCIV